MPHMGAFYRPFRRYRQQVCATTPLSTQMYSLSFSLALSLPLPPYGGGGCHPAFLPWCFQLRATVDRFAMQRYQLVSDSSQLIQGSWKWLLLIYRLLGRCESDTCRRGQIRGRGGALRSVGMLSLYHSPTGLGAAVSSPCSNAVKPPRDEKREMQKKEMSENFCGGWGVGGGFSDVLDFNRRLFLRKSHICVIRHFKKRRIII